MLAADGKKMSKRLKNYPPPDDILDKYGADALRLYLISSPVVRACKRVGGGKGGKGLGECVTIGTDTRTNVAWNPTKSTKSHTHKNTKTTVLTTPLQ